MARSPPDNDDAYFSDDTTKVDSGSENDTAYETDPTDDSDVDAEATGCDGEKGNSA